MSDDIKDSPLLVQRQPIQFDRVKAEQVEPAIHLLLEQMNQRLNDLGSAGTPHTYRDVLLSLDTLTEPLDFAMSVVRHLEAVTTYPALRAAHNAVQGPVSSFYTSIALNAGLWQAIKAVEQSTSPGDLSAVDARFLKKTVTDFRRAGADLDSAGKRRLEELDISLTKITTRFSQNVLDATNSFELIITDEAKLSGLPESAVMAARQSAQTKGREGWRLTLHAPSYVAALTYLDDRDLRRELWEASNSRATSGELDNRTLILEILKLRRQKARLLGYPDFADFVLEERMAHTGSQSSRLPGRSLYARRCHISNARTRVSRRLGRELGSPL